MRYAIGDNVFTSHVIAAGLALVVASGAVLPSPALAQTKAVPPECAASARSASAALTVYPDVPLYAAQFGEETVPGPPLRFRTRVTKLPAARRGERILVRAADGSQCGYIQASRILDNPPLKVSDIVPDQTVQKGFFGYARNEWTIRAMLRTNPKLDATASDVMLFDAPGEGKPYRRSRAFGLFNIFKVDRSNGNDPEDWWYFVGGNKVADDKVLSGWVRGGNLFLWGSGIAVYPAADRSAPFDVYTDLQTLQQGNKAGLIATRTGLESPAGRDTFKFPVLDQIFTAGDRTAAAPVAYEIGFVGATSALKAGALTRLGLPPDEAEQVLKVGRIMTRGFVRHDAQQRSIAFYIAMEPARFSLFAASMTELCRAMSDDDDLRNRLLSVLLTLAHNLGGDPYSSTETIAEYLDRIISIPRRHFASWLGQPAAELANMWGSATPERKMKWTLSVCRSAYLLQQMGAGQKVESIDDLQLDPGLGKVELKPGKSLRAYSWLWSTESRIEFYFVPAVYLPQD